MKIYADNAATTRLSDEALRAMMPYFQDVFGNPSSLYSAGQKAREALEGPFHSVNNTNGLAPESAAELMSPDFSKRSGIKRMMAFLGDGMESTVGVGDGENDVDMIDVCNIGIAMGNACDMLKAHASYVTTDIEDGGIANAMKYSLGRLG